jgi:uncharacterized protein YrrD
MKVSELRGRTVITVPGGENIGTVEDVLLHADEQRLGALIVRSPRFPGPQVLMMEDIRSFNGDTVAAADADKFQDQTRLGASAQMASFGAAAGRKVATASGNYAGELSDVDIDPTTGKITSYEVTGGWFERTFRQTHTIEASEHTRLGKDLLIVEDEVLPAQREEKVLTIEASEPTRLNKDPLIVEDKVALAAQREEQAPLPAQGELLALDALGLSSGDPIAAKFVVNG